MINLDKFTNEQLKVLLTIIKNCEHDLAMFDEWTRKAIENQWTPAQLKEGRKLIETLHKGGVTQ